MPPKGTSKSPIDWNVVAELCKIHCTKEEIVAVLNASRKGKDILSENCLYRACKKDLKLSFAQFYEGNKDQGCASLRRQQWAAAVGAKRKKTILVNKKTVYPDGTVTFEQIPKDIDFYPTPSERMQIWIGQQILNQTSNLGQDPNQKRQDQEAKPVEVSFTWQTIQGDKPAEDYFDQKLLPEEVKG